MNVLPRAIDLNNLAVAQLQADRSNEAIHLFRVALADMKDRTTATCHHATSTPPTARLESQSVPTFSETSMEPEETNAFITMEGFQDDDSIVVSSSDSPDHHTHQAQALKPKTLQSIPLRSEYMTAQQDTRPLDHSFISMFDRAFCIDDDCEDEDELMSAVVIMYNMALVNHARGIDRGTNSYLSNALQLYEMALNLLENMSLFPPEAVLLLLALYNNVAHIYSHRYAIQPTRKFLDLLHQVLKDFASPTIEEEDYALFYLNALVYENNRDFAFAPAA